LFYLTVLEPQSVCSPPHKTDFKSPAEERLIRKMAKMALNGYEIGIQRKIKPADHIQSMADKIQDTVVTKHPLNTECSSSGESSCDNTLKKSLNKSFDKGYKTHDSIQTLGDRIKETIISNHPATINSINGHVPPPPPIPKSPIPTFNTQSTPVALPMNNKRPSNFIPKNLNSTFTSETNHVDKISNGTGYLNKDDLNIDKTEKNSNTLRKKTGFEKASFLNGMNSSNNEVYNQELNLNSNTLNKKKMFENNEALTGSNNFIEAMANKFVEKNIIPDATSDKNIDNSSLILPHDDQQSLKLNSVNSVHDNTEYSLKPVNNSNGKFENMESENQHDSGDKEDSDSEIIVKRRPKKNIINDDGRRDSHIVARPLSTMTSLDVADGMFPVCHKCDKAITR
jgi:hypothetical protein